LLDLSIGMSVKYIENELRIKLPFILE